jgi:hypothetical protein
MGNARLRAAAIVAAVLLIAGSVFAASAWARSFTVSGIVGHVLVGPLSPVRHTLPGVDGDEAAYSATVIVYDADGEHEVTRVRSDAAGEFRIVLEPGMYTLRPLPEQQPFPLAKPVVVQVQRGEFTDISLLYDTQIR